MGEPHVKFNTENRPEFYKDVRANVNKYFKDNNISKYANTKMKIKSIFMIGLYFVPFILMVTGVVVSAKGVFLMWVLMGFGMSGVGLSIMHDSNHGAYSKTKWVNSFLGNLIHFVGGLRETWNIQHNILHHSFTNIDGYDEDIKTGTIRLSPYQKIGKMNRFQAFYAPIIYGMVTMYWSTTKDFAQLKRYKAKDLLKKEGLTYNKGVVKIIITKILYFALFLGLPLAVIDLPWWHIVGGFLVMHYITGLLLTLIFQSAHVVEQTEFFVPDENSSVENNWAIHQMYTTANFAHKSMFFSWFIGGLNYQIEHHLFPKICHIHYSNLSEIVRKTAEEHGLPYYHNKTFFSAVKSHFSLLNKLGRGTFDRRKAIA